MLGSALFRILPEMGHEVYGSLRQSKQTDFLKKTFTNSQNLIYNIDVLNSDQLNSLITQIQPDLIINCIGIIKQLDISNDPIYVLPINSILPYRLTELATRVGARLIHISTDCVFDGKKGNYLEIDKPNAEDLYGKSKEIGEIKNKSNVITLRISLIGHELQSNHSLVDWFLSQKNQVSGYKNAIFSGLTSLEMAKVIHHYIIPNENLYGLYHVSVNPISKYNLLKLIQEIYAVSTTIIPETNVAIDRSLNSDKFQKDTGYQPPDWKQLIQEMKTYYYKYKGINNV